MNKKYKIQKVLRSWPACASSVRDGNGECLVDREIQWSCCSWGNQLDYSRKISKSLVVVGTCLCCLLQNTWYLLCYCTHQRHQAHPGSVLICFHGDDTSPVVTNRFTKQRKIRVAYPLNACCFLRDRNYCWQRPPMGWPRVPWRASTCVD